MKLQQPRGLTRDNLTRIAASASMQTGEDRKGAFARYWEATCRKYNVSLNGRLKGKRGRVKFHVKQSNPVRTPARTGFKTPWQGCTAAV